MAEDLSIGDTKGSGADRLARVLQHVGRSQVRFAQELGYSAQTVNDVLHGREPMSRALAAQVSLVYGIELGWLLTGRGTAPDEQLPTVTSTTTAPGLTAAVRYVPGYFCCVACGGPVNSVPRDVECLHCGAHLLWPALEKVARWEPKER
jgi:transcriptional regulator with XRE-family HTH domain